jgi:hypothetical protein
MSLTLCGDCGAEIPEPHDTPYEARQACPTCGSTSRRRLVEVAASLTAGASISTAGSVERGLNDLRLAVLGILVGIALSVAFGIDASWPVQVAAGVATFACSAALIRWPKSRHLMMQFMHRVTGRLIRAV